MPKILVEKILTNFYKGQRDQIRRQSEQDRDVFLDNIRDKQGKINNLSVLLAERERESTDPNKLINKISQLQRRLQTSQKVNGLLARLLVETNEELNSERTRAENLQA
jgi:hypothetical protein